MNEKRLGKTLIVQSDYGEIKIEGAANFVIDDGNLLIYNIKGKIVAAWARGSWDSVKEETI